MAIKGARERARLEVLGEITAEARRQLAASGAASLSLRSVARSLGMVSSGIYRYVASRDELLTMLIVETYDGLGAAAERAVARTAGAPPLERWTNTCDAIRRWARAHPHEYALVYGTPVPGYRAPTDTIGPGARVSSALVSVVVDAARDGLLRPPPDVSIALAPKLAADLDALARDRGFEVSHDVMIRFVAAWTQLFGLLTFELFGQTQGAITAHGALFTTTAALMGRLIGLGDPDST